MSEEKKLLLIAIEYIKLKSNQKTDKSLILEAISSIAGHYSVVLRKTPQKQVSDACIVEFLENKTGYKNNLNKLYNSINQFNC